LILADEMGKYLPNKPNNGGPYSGVGTICGLGGPKGIGRGGPNNLNQ